MPLVDLNLHKNMNIKKVNGEYECGKRDLFACMIALKYVMAQKEYVNMLKAIDGLLKDLSNKISVISIDEVLFEMGFPLDWKKKLVSSK